MNLLLLNALRTAVAAKRLFWANNVSNPSIIIPLLQSESINLSLRISTTTSSGRTVLIKPSSLLKRFVAMLSFLAIGPDKGGGVDGFKKYLISKKLKNISNF